MGLRPIPRQRRPVSRRPSAATETSPKPHVAPDRSTLDLSEFYKSYHHFIVIMLQDASFAWGPREGGLPDMGAITAFSLGR